MPHGRQAFSKKHRAEDLQLPALYLSTRGKRTFALTVNRTKKFHVKHFGTIAQKRYSGEPAFVISELAGASHPVFCRQIENGNSLTPTTQIREGSNGRAACLRDP
jgi:hypothetical protein